ncbi:MAG: hypothetical protein ACXWLH_03845 [Candidatus Saccharimonadales bacterium]
MYEMSINLCGKQGVEVSDLLVDKIIDPTLRLSVGNVALSQVTAIQHPNDSGTILVTAVDSNLKHFKFKYAPNYEPFSFTAIGEDGQHVC